MRVQIRLIPVLCLLFVCVLISLEISFLCSVFYIGVLIWFEISVLRYVVVVRVQIGLISVLCTLYLYAP